MAKINEQRKAVHYLHLSVHIINQSHTYSVLTAIFQVNQG